MTAASSWHSCGAVRMCLQGRGRRQAAGAGVSRVSSAAKPSAPAAAAQGRAQTQLVNEAASGRPQGSSAPSLELLHQARVLLVASRGHIEGGGAVALRLQAGRRGRAAAASEGCAGCDESSGSR